MVTILWKTVFLKRLRKRGSYCDTLAAKELCSRTFCDDGSVLYLRHSTQQLLRLLPT